MNIYDFRRRGTIVFLALTVLVVAVFLYMSDRMVRDLSAQERERMQVWADATSQLANGSGASDVEFLLGIIERNHTIPVLLTDDAGEIISYRNFTLPEPDDSLGMETLSESNRSYLEAALAHLRRGSNVIRIEITPEEIQHLYYEDSTVLKRLSYYPYVQILVMLVFIAVVYFAVDSIKRVEQNKVWVGLSKETAHQLGTPISSLMAWVELLDHTDVPKEYVAEMRKDIDRLSTVASRFSKIGSAPVLESVDLVAVVRHAADYMTTRISGHIKLEVETPSACIPVKLSLPLFEWVMENLIRNAVDAMDGSGHIRVRVNRNGDKAVVTVDDTGKGIRRKDFNTVFKPGYTTKKRGWGLGLTLSKRIVEQYHGGRIYVSASEPGAGTTFAIELPISEQNEK